MKGARCDFKHPRDEQKHLVPCPFLQNRGFCLKGSRCDFSHGGNYPHHLSPPRPVTNHLTRSFYHHHQFPPNYPRRQGFFQTYPKPLMEISVQPPLPHTYHNYPGLRQIICSRRRGRFENTAQSISFCTHFVQLQAL